ncbi:MAG: hypothetical protein GVY33_11000 [Alphaproteobacteria bacterium]|nr:hypothetical protein [Alphaproteobacteria bacterium]
MLSFKVKNVNDAPVVGTPVGDLAVAEGAAVAIALPDDLFIDADLAFGDDLHVTAPGLPSWLAFDAATGELTGTAPNVEADSGYTVTLRATDSAGKTVETSFAVDVAGTNEAPQVTDDLTPPGAAEDAPFSWTLPAGLFNDPEGGPVTLSAGLAGGSPLPAWLGFDAATRTFTGVPSDADIGSLQLRVTAADHLGATTSVDATLDVANVNDAPEVTATIAGRSATAGEPMAPLAVTGFFTDADLPFGDALTFTAGAAHGSPLPEGLVFDGTTLSGTATAAGQHMLRITATDEAGESVAQEFRLAVDLPAGADDPLDLAAEGTVPMSALGGESMFQPSFYHSDRGGNLFYAEGETYWQQPEIDYMRLSNRSTYGERHVVLDGDKRSDVLGNDADNIILGNDGDNVLVGQGGDDTLYGAGGYDALYGGAGDDMLVSGTGSNDLHGGAGDDRYEIGGHGEAGLREGDLDTISDDAGANIVDFDGVTSGQMRFDMDGADLVVAVEGGGEVRIDDVEAGDATFEVQADDRSWDHAALLAAVEEVRAQTAAIAAEPASFKSDVLEGFLGDDAAPPANPDPIAAFVPDPGEVDAAPTDGRGGALAPADEPSGTFLAPDEGATTTTAAAAGLAPKTALEEDPAYA